jgi:hypothetical protein
MIDEDLLKRIEKIKRLAEAGEDGEKETAKALLDRLMRQYNISDKDLKESVRKYWYTSISGYKCKELLVQICSFYPDYGKNDGVWITHVPALTGSDKRSAEAFMYRQKIFGKNTIIHATREEFIEIMAKYEIYHKSLIRHYNSFYYAFLLRNDLLQEADANKKVSKKDLELADTAFRMAGGIEKSTVNKLLDTTAVRIGKETD